MLIHLGFTTAYSIILWLSLVYIIKPSREGPNNLWIVEAFKLG